MAFRKKTITGKILEKRWQGKPRISNENGEDWLNPTKEVLNKTS